MLTRLLGRNALGKLVVLAVAGNWLVVMVGDDFVRGYSGGLPQGGRRALAILALISIAWRVLLFLDGRSRSVAAGAPRWLPFTPGYLAVRGGAPLDFDGEMEAIRRQAIAREGRPVDPVAPREEPRRAVDETPAAMRDEAEEPRMPAREAPLDERQLATLMEGMLDIPSYGQKRFSAAELVMGAVAVLGVGGAFIYLLIKTGALAGLVVALSLAR